MSMGSEKTVLLESFKWVPIPGTEKIELYALIRRPCVTCSNTYILKSPQHLIVIDPGADPAQIEHIRRVILDCRSYQDYQVFIFLTHCHIDHYLACDLLMDDKLGGRLICHRVAAEAIEERNEQVTLADMNGSVLPVCTVAARLFESHEAGETVPLHSFIIENSCMEIGLNIVVPVQSIAVSDKDRIEVFHAPGHSPDSVCYRVGSLLFTGDIHLATTPGIAGKFGWDNECLACTLSAILEKGQREGISLILPGHGNALTFEKAEAIFENARRDAAKLTDLALFNRDRSLYISEYAIVLLEEASIVFSVIAAHLLKVSYYLEMLDERDSAREILCSIDQDAIEAILEDFNVYVGELKAKRGAPLISKAVQFARKVEKVFEPVKISYLFESHFIHRIRSLLSDFVNVVYGIRFSYQETAFDLNGAVAETVLSIQQSPFETESLFAALENDREFVDALTRNISREPLFSAMTCTFTPAEGAPNIFADRLLFQDMLIALIEQFAVSGINKVFLSSGSDGEKIFLSVRREVGGKAFALRDSKMRYIQHTMKLACGEFEHIPSTGGETYRYLFPRKNVGDLNFTSS